MTSTMLVTGPRLAVALVALTALAAVVVTLGRLGHGRQIVVAAVRAAVQLTAVSLLIVVIVESVAATAGFVLLMWVVAAATSGRRITGTGRGWWAAVPVGVGSLPVVVALLAAGLLPPRGIAVVPVAGILIGGAMTATSLAGRRALDELTSRRGEVEAGLALGLLPRDAVLLVCRPAAGQALVPALDQTRTVGLVTLPGAFVGVLLGGADPLTAGVTQLFVLIGLLAVEAVAVVVTMELVASGRLRPA
ncbi:ABC transporter permease [Micromonospora sagamiensis]|uniref:Putative ABC transport system permease protein n=1 Tax=Micromonospora sagamiensis TaxID=47875 RepID=A0A562WFU1_9ACTN|nr:ABC transporter permease [Micromonospora sagamiensis]TWJ28951.1 putative ABC transport system permease protein [Micromonospora sagamiensis]BCL18024.1 ABC transporter permease [Micromonospora sagamiensis]